MRENHPYDNQTHEQDNEETSLDMNCLDLIEEELETLLAQILVQG